MITQKGSVYLKYKFSPLKIIHQFLVDRPFEKGKVVANRYKITSILGMGSFGMVYQCEDLHKNLKVAMKQLRPSKGKNKQEVQWFQEEVQLLETLNHPAIPKIHTSFNDEGQWFYIMDYIDGENLEELLFEQKQVLTERESVELLKKLLEIVDYLHKRKIYHGDLRIPNILLKHQNPILIDLGLAFSFNENDKTRPKKINKKHKEKTLIELKQEDYFDLGDILLFLLYSTYPKKNKKALPWTEELSLEPATSHLLKRLLGITERYKNAEEILNDIDHVLKQLDGESS